MTTLTVGHTDVITFNYLDANGNPMLSPVTPDSVPTWTDVPSAADTFTVAQNGMSATMVAMAAGQDTVTCTVIVGGKTFTATGSYTIQAAPQVLTSIVLVDSIQ